MTDSPPAYLFVVRHGNRLDAADKKWHLTSPTPYDPPLTYGGFLQARQVGNQIGNYLEQAKIDSQQGSRNGHHGTHPTKRRRFKIVIHSSPFLRCVQTSIGISSGLAQTSPDSIYNPSDIILPRSAPGTRPFEFKSSLLRIDSFLGEWLSPEYFETITPPPGPALMVGGAKAELLRREDYGAYADFVPRPEESERKVSSSSSLWQASPTTSPGSGMPSPGAENGGVCNLSQLLTALPSPERKGYVAPKPTYAVSGSGRIPDGFVSHARDACVTVDYQWDSTREPLDFGDGGKFGEEWTAMHKRFRGGLRKLLNWYATTDSAANLVTKTATATATASTADVEREDDQGDQGDDVETVVVIVSHGAGCNALIGAITHQPVLMDVGIASITMATRKPNLDYGQLRKLAEAAHPPDAVAAAKPLVQVDKLYDMRLSASTEHLRPNSNSTPVLAGAPSAGMVWNAPSHGARGRTPTFDTNSGGPVMSPFTYSDPNPVSSPGSRSASANAAVGKPFRRDSASFRPLQRAPTVATSSGLWTPAPSSLRLMDEGGEDGDDFASMMPNFDQKRFQRAVADEVDEPLPTFVPSAARAVGGTSTAWAASHSVAKNPPRGPVLAAPIKLVTNLGPDKPIEELKMSKLGGGLGGLWGLPPPPDEAERFRDLSHSKRRWTLNERA
ncbi:phosphoglycerate mutase family protein [Drechmeria coniospora]|uniref:Phosphoglycerate mutase family protein n=1 Tax=Drechmeria coniospora TaxID=98403 RepID=A0A151GQY1_DRECN|nr:phosphoglycerate mutase family protein [Drechmeria coniospora]KYK59517.1 phosphoglycerate mutase family protein [Drechmeria coniospora]